MNSALSRHTQAKMLPDAYGCAVANRFGDLLDDDADPFDLLSKVELEKEKKKKKDDEKKGKQKKPGQKESQKDRRVPIASGGQDPAPGQLTARLRYCYTPQIQTILAAASISRLGGTAKSGQFAQALSAADGAKSARLLSTCSCCQDFHPLSEAK